MKHTGAKKNGEKTKAGYYPNMKLTEAEIEFRRREEERLHLQKQPTPQKASRFPLITVRKGLMIACAGVFVISATLLIRYYANINRAKEAASELREIYVNASQSPSVEATPGASQTPAPTVDTDNVALDGVSDELEDESSQSISLKESQEPTAFFDENWPTSYPNNPDLRISDSFQKLRQENNDIVGWLSIEDVLDEPVFQRDNDYYLTHDAAGEENATGALFLDENCNLRTLTHNLLIHGHNMKEGAMFGSLKKYKVKDAQFYKTHPYITFHTLYEEATYVIFAVAEVSIRSTDRYYVPFWLYLNFFEESAFDAYLNKLKEFSHFQTQVDVEPGDRLLTLATCSGTDTATRLLVVARKLRDNEDTIALNRGILSTQVK